MAEWGGNGILLLHPIILCYRIWTTRDFPRKGINEDSHDHSPIRKHGIVFDGCSTMAQVICD